jgi:uncharacterized protein with PQ loop repeat
MYSASILYFICYIPELYANYKNKNGNIYNVPEKVIMILATGLAFSYAIINKNTELTTNYGPLLVLDVIALQMRLYYAYINHSPPICVENTQIRTLPSIIYAYFVDVNEKKGKILPIKNDYLVELSSENIYP